MTTRTLPTSADANNYINAGDIDSSPTTPVSNISLSRTLGPNSGGPISPPMYAPALPVTDLESMGDQQQQHHAPASWREYLLEDVDPATSTAPLAGYCFMTGFTDAITFSAAFVWCGFQTGNTIQLALALARLFSPGNTDRSFRLPDRIALISILTFLAGASLGRLGDRIGNNRRLWLALGTLLQALLTTGAALAIWQGAQGSNASARGQLAWTNALSMVGIGFASATIGLQGIMGKRVKSEFATTVVLTTVWCELLADPRLFRARGVISRDHKLLAISALFLGGFSGKAIVDRVGSAGTLGIAAGLRVVIALAWLAVPALKRADGGDGDGDGKMGKGGVVEKK